MKTSCILVTALLALSIDTQALAQDHASRASETPAATAPQGLLEQLLEGLRDGNRETVLTLFEYFEHLVGARDAAADRRIVGYVLELIEQEFGRPQRFERLQAPSTRYMSADVESAADEQWNASPCLFKSFAVGTVFAQSDAMRPVELAVTVCTGPQVERPALRRIEFRFLSPDARTVEKIRSVLERTRAEARRPTIPQN
jgi:hypothetical protein